MVDLNLQCEVHCSSLNVWFLYVTPQVSKGGALCAKHLFRERLSLACYNTFGVLSLGLSFMSSFFYVSAAIISSKGMKLLQVLWLLLKHNAMNAVPLFLFWVIAPGVYLQGNPPKRSEFLFYSSSPLAKWGPVNDHWGLCSTCLRIRHVEGNSA